MHNMKINIINVERFFLNLKLYLQFTKSSTKCNNKRHVLYYNDLVVL